MKHLLRSAAIGALLILPAACGHFPVAMAGPVTSGAYYPMAGGGQYGLSVVTNTALTIPAGAAGAEICVETAGIRYTDDGTAASSSVGIPVASGVCFQYFGQLSKLKFTAQSGSPTIDVLYYKTSD